MEQVSLNSSFHSLGFIEVELSVERSQNCFHLACNARFVQVIWYVFANHRDNFENIAAGSSWRKVIIDIIPWHC